MRSYAIHNERTSRKKQRQPNRFRSQGGNRMNIHWNDYFNRIAAGPYKYKTFVRNGQSKREYPNKNANIEYYTDEKGNIRKRKKV